MTKPDTPSTKVNLSVLAMGEHEYPKFEEKRGRKWVSYGAGDEYPTYLHELYMTSSIHCAIINTTADMIAGQGFTTDEPNSAWIRLNLLFDQELISKVALDLKLYGQFYLCVIWNKQRTKIAKVDHMPVHTMRAGVKNEKGEVDTYYYAPKWEKKTKPEGIPTYNADDKVSFKQVYHGRRYDSQAHYYGVPDYVGATSFIELDKQIAQFHLNDIKNNFRPGYHFAFHNGEPDDDIKRDLERDINNKFAGPEAAGSVLVTYDDGGEGAGVDITPMESNGNHEMYQYLSDRVDTKILTGHGVTSPSLFGIPTPTGLSSSSEEMATAYRLYYHNRVKPMQDIIIKAAEELSKAGTETAKVDVAPNVPEGLELSSLKLEEATNWLIENGEGLSDEWEEVFSHKVDYDLDDDLNNEITTLEAAVELAKTVRAHPGKESEQDTSMFKIRYKYTTLKSSGATHSSRDFCNRMVRANKIYRKEDIVRAGDMAVNPGWGPNGANTYSVWLYKGGGDCQHFWTRTIYLKKGGKVSVNEARKLISKLPISEREAAKWDTNESEVAKAPRNMPNNGFLSPK